MRILIKHEILKMRKSFILYALLVLPVLMIFSAYWMPYLNFLHLVEKLMYIAKTTNAPLETLLASNSAVLNDTISIFASHSIVDYVLTFSYPLLSISAPFLISYSIGNEYSLKTIRTIVSHASRSKVFFAKYISNVLVLVTLFVVSIISGVVFSSIFRVKIAEVLGTHIPLFQVKPVVFDFLSKMPIQLLSSVLLVITVTAVVYLINIVTKNAFIGSAVSLFYLYLEAALLHDIHVEKISLSVNVLSITSRIFYYFEGGSVQNLVSKQLYTGQPLMIAIPMVLLYLIIPSLISYTLFKREDI